MSYVFVSYSRRNAGFAGRIVRRLRRLGIEVWFDSSSIPIGVIFANSIEDGIRDSAATIFIISEASLASEWCRREYDWTVAAKKTLVPILIEPVDARQNWLNARQRIDMIGEDEGEYFDVGIYKIVKGLHTGSPTAVSDEALDQAARQVGWSDIDGKIEDLRGYAEKAEDYLNDVAPSPDSRFPAFSAQTNRGDGEQLASFALGSVRDAQIAANSAQVIARTGNLHALERIGSAVMSPDSCDRAFDALAEILRMRQSSVPRVVPWRAYPRYLWQTGVRTLRGGMMRSSVWSSVFMAMVALCFVSFVSFGPDSSVRPLARLGHMASGAVYGALLGLGIALSAVILPRLYALGFTRHLVGALLGWLCGSGAFVFYNSFVYFRAPSETYTTLMPLSALLILGFVLTGMIGAQRGLFKAALAFFLCVTGATLALALSCDWVPFYPRLLNFSYDTCVGMSITTAVLLALGPALPALWLAAVDARHFRFSWSQSRKVQQ